MVKGAIHEMIFKQLHEMINVVRTSYVHILRKQMTASEAHKTTKYIQQYFSLFSLQTYLHLV